MVRKPSKELLKIQNFSDSTDEDEVRLNSSSRRSNSKRRNSRVSSAEHKSTSQDQADSQETGNDDQCGLSSTSKEHSPRNKSRKSPSYSQKSPRSNKKPRKSPEQSMNCGSNSLQTCSKSLNSQIREYIKSPSKSRKLTTFDAFNHTSSLKLSHMHSSSSQEKQPGSSSKYDNPSKYDQSYYDYYHPRRSSREVLDFTSKRKSQKDLTKLDDEAHQAATSAKRHSLKGGGGEVSGKEEADNGGDNKRKGSNIML